MTSNTVAQINLNHLVHNVDAIRKKSAPSGIIPVVKANAYGHGAGAVTRRLVKEGVTRFAVAQFQEAMELRDSGISQSILIENDSLNCNSPIVSLLYITPGHGIGDPNFNIADFKKLCERFSCQI